MSDTAPRNPSPTLNPTLNLGAHLTISDGLPKAMELARSIGATNFQFFTRNPRGGQQRALSDREIAEGRVAREACGIRTLIAHMPYTVNLASPKPSAWEFAKICLFEDLRWADRAGVDVVVLHPGSHVGEGVAAGIERIVEAARPALEGYTGRTRLLFESMSGMGSEVGGRPEEIGTIIERLDRHPALGVCLDSCHQFASGFDLRTPAGVDSLVRAWGDAVGLDRIGAMHLNDSKTALESHKDRHELIGKGLLGEAGIRAVVTHPFLSTLPLCIETPVDDYAEYAGEIARVREIAARPA